jgi:hypothetical protein
LASWVALARDTRDSVLLIQRRNADRTQAHVWAAWRRYMGCKRMGAQVRSGTCVALMQAYTACQLPVKF